jgi:hypothetical protein
MKLKVGQAPDQMVLDVLRMKCAILVLCGKSQDSPEALPMGTG